MVYSFIKNLLRFIYVYEGFACMYINILHVPGACEGQNRVLDSLELELWMAVNQHVGSGNWIQVFCKSNMCS